MQLNVQNAVGVAALSVLLPLAFHFLLSPVAALLIVPLLILLAIAACILFNVILGIILDRRSAKYQRNLSHASRPLTFSTPAAWEAVQTRSRWMQKSMQSMSLLRQDYPQASTLANDILGLIVRDFVLAWYSDISSSPEFPGAIAGTVHGALDTLLRRMESMDMASFIVRRIMPKLTSHVNQFKLSETALRGAGLERHLTQSEELDLLLASRYAGKGGRLHPAVDNLSTTFTKQTEEAHLRRLVELALPYLLPAKDSNSRAVCIVVREIVACTVLAPITDALSDPDFWNRTIDQLAGAAIRQQKLISRVRSILESQSPSPARARLSKSRQNQYETITLQTSTRQFEAFLRSISRCDSLLDARRLKNDITGEVRRTRALLAKHENEEWINGRKTEDYVAFLDRLYTAKRKVEKRIAVLGGEESSRASVLQEADVNTTLGLRDILTNPSSLSYFMEFMDRRGRSLLVQFWLTVETFKNPLESVDSDTSADEADIVADANISKTLQEDMILVNNLYFSGPIISPALSSISRKHIEAIRSYAEQPSNEVHHERKVRRSVMLAQREVEQDMESDFEDFRRSDFWFRVVADLAPKLDSDTITHTAASPKLSHTSSNAPGLLASLTKSLTPDLSRANSNAVVHDASISAPSLNAGTSSHSSKPSIPRNGSGAQAQKSLQFLVSPTIEHEEGRAPLFNETDDGKLVSADADEALRMEAIQAAVTDILASENQQSTIWNRSRQVSEGSFAPPSEDSLPAYSQKRKAMFEDVEETVDALDEQQDDIDDGAEGTFQMPAPGDLQLSSEIARLTDKISHIQSQDVILDTLIRKAELTGDAQELRLLRRSKSALERELRQLTFQKTQYEQQESANKLVPGKTKASIVNATAAEEDGKSVVRYLIEVQQLGPNGENTSGWVVARRYSEFFVMHQRLRERFVTVKNLDFPGKRLVTTLSSSMVDNRRIALEKYLQNLLAIPMVCESQELRAFLSRESPFVSKDLVEPTSKDISAFPGQNLVRTMYRSFTESIDDMFFGPSMLDVMIGRLTRQAAEFAGIVGSGVNDEDLVAHALRASGKTAPEETLMQLPGDLKPLGGETSSSPFTAPICDFILSVFELDEKNNWLRRQAIVIILQQVLGDTVERKFRENMKYLLDEPHLLTYINMFKDSLWPGGQLKPQEPPRSMEEKARTRDEANRKLSALLPDVASNMMGRSNARRGARRIFAVLQNRRLNQHIVYTVLDEIFVTLFPDASTSLNSL